MKKGNCLEHFTANPFNKWPDILNLGHPVTDVNNKLLLTVTGVSYGWVNCPRVSKVGCYKKSYFQNRIAVFLLTNQILDAKVSVIDFSK